MSKSATQLICSTTAQAPVVVSCAGPNDIAGGLCASSGHAIKQGLVQSAPVEVEVVQENSAPLFTAAYSYRTQEYARRRTAGSVSSGQVGSMPQ
jgi:hypothetical protein